jgi:hypothetical protein
MEIMEAQTLNQKQFDTQAAFIGFHDLHLMNMRLRHQVRQNQKST